MGLFSFIGGLASSVVKGVTGIDLKIGSSGKKAAQIMATDAAKQRAHELRMANLAAQAQAGKAKQTQIIMIVAVVIGLIVLIFVMKKRR